MSNPALEALLNHLSSHGYPSERLIEMNEGDLSSLTGPGDTPLTKIQNMILKAYIKKLKADAAASASATRTATREQLEKLESENQLLHKQVEENQAILEERDRLAIVSDHRKKRVEDIISFTTQMTVKSINEVRRMMDELIRLGTDLDICFCMDGTGSMADCIEEVKQCIVKVSNTIYHKTGMHSRFGLVIYRDYCDEEQRIQVWNFGSSEEIAVHLSTIEANGGGDAAEDCFGGLWAAITQVDWRAPCRLIIWMGDAPQHGNLYNGGVDDDFPEGDPDGRTAAEIFKKLHEQGSLLVFCKLNDSTDPMIRQLLLEVIPYGMNMVRVFDVGKDMMDFLSGTIEASVSLTNEREKPGRGKEKPYTLVPAEWIIDSKWNREESGEVLTFTGYEGSELHPLLDLLMDGPNVKTRTVMCQMTLSPVDKGEMRFAFYAKIIEMDERIKKREKKAVMKESRYEGLENTRKALINQAHIQAVALFLANVFSCKMSKIGIEKRLKYIPVEIIRIADRPENKNYFSIEPFLSGKYLKFNNNSGYVEKDLEKIHPILQTFSHFTWAYSNATVMVVDLQGVVNGHTYKLTDPAIHTADPMKCLKDKTNLGLEGMSKFFSSHTCNNFCKMMKLKRPDVMDAGMSMDREDAREASDSMFDIEESYTDF